MKRFVTGVVASLALLCLLAFANGRSLAQFSTDPLYSFESSMEGWTPDATDMLVPPNWSITRSQDRAFLGTWSLAHYMNNTNDATKIWVERPFAVTAGRTYDVTVNWRFATSDSGPVNNWSLLGAIQTYNPEVRSDFVTVGSTYNGGVTDWVWTPRSYTRRVTLASNQSTIWVAVGLWGTWEVARTYYVDAVQVSIKRVL